MSLDADPKPRNRYRFVTRELFAGIAVIAVVFAWALDHWRLTAARNNAQDEMRKQATETKRVTDSLWAVQATHTASEEKRVLDAVGFGSRLKSGYGYNNATTLAEALEIAKSQLVEDGKQEFVPLLTEERVRAAILAGIASYSAKVEDIDKRFPSANVLTNWVALKPTLLKIAEAGTWPPGCSFSANYGLSDSSAEYDGLLLQILLKPSSNGPKAGVPIITLYYGRYESRPPGLHLECEFRFSRGCPLNMLRRYQFSIRDMFWATAAAAVLLSVTIFFIRHPWVKVAAVGLIVAVLLSLPTIFGLLSQRGDSKYSEPFISPAYLVVVAILVGLSLPFLLGWLIKVLVAHLKA